MKKRELFGWLLIAIGILLLVSPFIYGFSGFFFTAYAGTPEINFDVQLPYIILGGILAVIGYYLAKPHKKSVLDKLGK